MPPFPSRVCLAPSLMGSKMRLPARLPCLFRFVPSPATMCITPSHTTLYHFNRHIPNHATPDRRFLRCHTAVSVVSLKRPSQDALHSLQAHIFQTCAVTLVGQVPKG